MGNHLLSEARALRAAFPDAAAMRELPVSALPQSPVCDAGAAAYRAAQGYLRDEMLLVQNGRANSLTVLDDEIAHVESFANGRRLLPPAVTGAAGK
jgi:hypothetical protein